MTADRRRLRQKTTSMNSNIKSTWTSTQFGFSRAVATRAGTTFWKRLRPLKSAVFPGYLADIRHPARIEDSAQRHTRFLGASAIATLDSLGKLCLGPISHNPGGLAAGDRQFCNFFHKPNVHIRLQNSTARQGTARDVLEGKVRCLPRILPHLGVSLAGRMNIPRAASVIFGRHRCARTRGFDDFLRPWFEGFFLGGSLAHTLTRAYNVPRIRRILMVRGSDASGTWR